MNKKNVWKIIGVFIAIILMLYWLFAGTKIEEESDGIYHAGSNRTSCALNTILTLRNKTRF